MNWFWFSIAFNSRGHDDVLGLTRSASVKACSSLLDIYVLQPAPLKFQFPVPASSVSRRESLPFSPIHRSSMRAQFKGIDGCKTCEDDVRALPMSPALLISQTTSTPGPAGVTMETPTCRSILENGSRLDALTTWWNYCRNTWHINIVKIIIAIYDKVTWHKSKAYILFFIMLYGISVTVFTIITGKIVKCCGIMKC